MMFLDIIYNILTPFRCSPIVHVETVNKQIAMPYELLVGTFVNEWNIILFTQRNQWRITDRIVMVIFW